MPIWWMFVVTGFLAGIASGMFGIGGGIIIVPVLVLGFKMEQQVASGTSLIALLLPVGAFAVWNYWQAGKEVRHRSIICCRRTLRALAGSISQPSTFAFGTAASILRSNSSGSCVCHPQKCFIDAKNGIEERKAASLPGGHPW